MNCSDFYSTFIAVLALVVSIIAIISTIRYQLITIINTQFADKAREANSNLNARGEIRPDADVLSAIVSSIITARQLFNYRLSVTWIPYLSFINKQSFIDQFYLQLDTSIRIFVQKVDLSKNYITSGDDTQKEMIIKQFISAKEFLAISIERDKNGFFSKF